MTSEISKPTNAMAQDQKAIIPIPEERIASKILLIRGHKVMLDSDLADVYGVTTRALNQAVKRNQARFPEDFVFQLNTEEVEELNRSQSVTGSQKHRDPRFRPYAFNEHGAVMLATVLNSPRAVQASIQIVRTFVRLRQMLATDKDLRRKLESMEKKYDKQFKAVIQIVEYLLAKDEEPESKKRIGFR